jgi:hypothetical protein
LFLLLELVLVDILPVAVEPVHALMMQIMVEPVAQAAVDLVQELIKALLTAQQTLVAVAVAVLTMQPSAAKAAVQELSLFVI